VVVWNEDAHKRVLAAVEIEFARCGIYGAKQKDIADLADVDPKMISYHYRHEGPDPVLALVNAWLRDRMPLINDIRAAILDWVSVETRTTLYNVDKDKGTIRYLSEQAKSVPLIHLVLAWIYPYVWYARETSGIGGLPRVLANISLVRPEYAPEMLTEPWSSSETFIQEVFYQRGLTPAVVADAGMYALHVIAHRELRGISRDSSGPLALYIAGGVLRLIDERPGAELTEELIAGIDAILTTLKLERRIPQYLVRPKGAH
jgi:hypothetical protein